MTKAACFFLLTALGLPAWAQVDSYGGWQKLQGPKTGFFHAAQVGGRWWLVTPAGNVFFVKGVDSVDLGPDANISPDAAKKLAAERVRQLKGWGFNTVGAWSARLPGMPYTLPQIG